MKEKQIEGLLWKFKGLRAKIKENKEKQNYQHHTGGH
jgi:hypothetical protein